MKRLMLAAACVALSGCTNLANFNSIHRPVKLQNEGSQLIDAKQRAIIVWPNVVEETTTTRGGREIELQKTTPAQDADGKPKDETQTITIKTTGLAPGEHGGSTEVVRKTVMEVCAEPSPDVFSVLAASGEFGVSNPAGVSVTGSGASTESGASLSRRTTTILAQRDAYYRLCEARANGWIDDIDLMIGQRNNQLSLVGLLAIEQLTGAVAAPTAALGGTAQAVSASAIQAVATARTAEVKRNGELNKQLEIATTARDEAKDKLDKLEKPAADADKDKTDAYNTNKLKLEKALQSAQDKVDGLTTELDTSNKMLSHFNKALDTAAATGSSAASIPAVIIPQTDPKAQEKAAEAVVQIVSMMNGNDMGPTICLRYLRDPASLGLQAYAQCSTILEKYADGMQAQVASISADTALQQELVRILASVQNPSDGTVYKDKIKPILDLLGVIKAGGSASGTSAPNVKSDQDDGAIIHAPKPGKR